MATYAQWRRAADKGPGKRRFTWVCGPERVLVEEVVTTITAQVGPPATDHVLLTAGEVPERAVWDAAAQYPVDPDARRLVTIREAQKLANWPVLATLLAAGRELPHLHLLLVSTEDGFTKTRASAEDKPVLAPHLAALRDASTGQLVSCTALSEPDLQAWVQRALPGAGANLAWHLLQRTGGDLAATASLCGKLAVLGSHTEALVDLLATAVPSTSFADALAAGDKPSALAAAAVLDPDEIGAAIGLLDSRLSVLARMHQALAAGLTAQEMIAKLRLPPFLVSRYRRTAVSYGPAKIRDRRAVLATADAAWRRGARQGVAEYIAALW